MEQARLFLAIALSILVFIVWEFFFVKREMKPPENVPPEIAEKTPEQTPEPMATPKPEMTETMAGETVSPPPEPETVTIDTPLYQATLSNLGAVIESYKLKNYRETKSEDSPFLQLLSPEQKSLAGMFVKNGIPNVGRKYFETEGGSGSIVLDTQPATITFRVRENGIIFEKRYTFTPDTYLIGLSTRVDNQSYQAVTDSIALSVTSPMPQGATAYGFEGPIALMDKNLLRVSDVADIKGESAYTGELGWVATVDKYFMSAIIPVKPVKAGMRVAVESDTAYENRFVPSEFTLEPGMSWKQDYKAYFGPKSVDLLDELGYDLGKAYKLGRWGLFDFIAIPFLKAMNWIYRNLIPNYGVAIIMLTIFIKLLLWPLGNKGYKSMNEMKKIQPLMANLREKYKDDRKKMNEELMNLYKTYKINPVGGCLPMILQIPVFIAFYGMLYEAIELRHAPFMLWIDDLSAPDRLFHFNVDLPLIQPPVGIPVLTIIMGATMLLQQKMSPPPGDPTQAKIMMFMPIFFTFIFINFPSGLVLYWLVNNILSIAQQYYVSKKSK